MEATNTRFNKIKLTSKTNKNYKCPLFDEIKRLIKNGRNKETINAAIERIQAIESEFIIYGDIEGAIFSKNHLAKAYLKAAKISKDLTSQIFYLHGAQSSMYEIQMLQEQDNNIYILN